jgi:signal transduction histidine kinase
MKGEGKGLPAKTTGIGIYLLKVFSLAVVYHLAARVGLLTAYVQINTSPVWPPTGIALAALLIFGVKYWPGISLGVFVGSLSQGTNLDVAVGMTIGNTLEALAGAVLLKRFFSFQNSMDHVRDVVGLMVVSIFVSMISATIGTMTLLLTGNTSAGFIDIWPTWWIGDLLGALVVAPVVLVWVKLPASRARSRDYVEGAILLALLILVSWYVFGGIPPEGILHQALIYLVFPFIIWSALLLEQYGATLAILIVSGISIWGTMSGLGPFSVESKNDSLILLQTFMAVVSLTALILAATTIERREATKAAQQRAEELGTLSDSSKAFLDNFDIASIYNTICRMAVMRLGLDVVWIESPKGEGDSQIQAFHGLPPQAIDTFKKEWESMLGTQRQNSPRIGSSDDLASPDRTNLAYKSFAIFPLVFSNRTIGNLKMLSKNKDFFTHDKQMLVQSYANLAVVVIQNTLLFDELRTTNRQLHALSQRLMQAQEEERLHLSRELHDESGQLLAALTVQFGLLEREAPESFRSRVAELKENAMAIQRNLHRLAVNLRPASLDHLGLITALQQFIREFSRQNKIPVEFETLGITEKRMPAEIETALFRTVQEALTNVVLHAQATRIDVLINSTNGHVNTIVEDNGIGFTPASNGTEEQLGLFGMRERIEMLGGILSIESAPGKGTTVKAELPNHD